MDNITESQYELLKNNEHSNENHENNFRKISNNKEKFYESELKDRQKMLILEDKGIKPAKFCGFCRTAPANSNDSGCSLI